MKVKEVEPVNGIYVSITQNPFHSDQYRVNVFESETQTSIRIGQGFGDLEEGQLSKSLANDVFDIVTEIDTDFQCDMEGKNHLFSRLANEGLYPSLQLVL